MKFIDRIVLESDGTEVDDEDYFHTLPPQTVFVILQKGEEWQLGKISPFVVTLYSQAILKLDRSVCCNLIFCQSLITIVSFKIRLAKEAIFPFLGSINAYST